MNEKIYATPFAKDYVDYLVSDVCVGIEIIKDGGMKEMIQLAGDENSQKAKQ